MFNGPIRFAAEHASRWLVITSVVQVQQAFFIGHPPDRRTQGCPVVAQMCGTDENAEAALRSQLAPGQQI
ncbi:hypothetical protein UK23_31005 [Lentzea aerocolonigenes]|uniref:Uncharacterized protein n=1 Tax=Lentzea aerocolonigenes TaxID=68170 RepID=A0A0F0GQ07_LENAE|nr:hypothetical protein UK23_31005 [Lentzea aerocolonigenes]